MCLSITLFITQSRDQLARKLWFKSYAHRFTADKMAGDPEKVEAFLLTMAQKIRVCR
jgi:Zn-dependent oligopeptidase